MSASTATASAATPGQSYGYRGGEVGSGGAQVFGSGIKTPVAVSNADGRVLLLRQVDANVETGFEVLAPDGATITIASFPLFFPESIAVSPDGSAVYLQSPDANVKFTSDGSVTPTYSQDPSWTPNVGGGEGLAVDPVTGDVLIAARFPDPHVYRVDSASGALISTLEGGSAGLASAPNGDFYRLGGLGKVRHFGADGSPKGEIVPNALNTLSTALGMAVNPQNGDVALALPSGFASANDPVVEIFTAANDLKDTIRLPAGVDPGGLAFSADGTKLYIGRGNGTAQVLELGTRPGLDAPTVSDLTPFGAQLSTEVATEGQNTTAHLEYCLAETKSPDPCTRYLTANAPSPWHALPDHSGLENPLANDEIADDLTGLEPLTKYLVRSYAINEVSKVENISAPVPFETPPAPPEVETGAASVEGTTAKLSGTINALGAQTTYHFEYGTTASYGSRVPASAEAIAGNERTTRTFNQTLKGLQPGTTYHYRLVASNVAGTTAGGDRTFTTLAADQVAPQRGYEQVTPADKDGFALNTNFGYQALPSGGALVYTAVASSAEASSAPLAGRYIARRGETNWSGRQPIDPPLLPTRPILAVATHAVSDDSEHAMVISPVALTPDATEEAANIYIRDLTTGSYRLVGTSTEPGAWIGMDGATQQNVYIGGAPDFSWIVFNSRYRLLPGAPPVAMYKWSETDGLSIVSLPPGGDVPEGNVWVQTFLWSANRLVSDDGDTVAFSLSDGERGVYRRSGGQTQAISVSQVSGDSDEPQPGIATGMSRNGRFVVFISDSQLTDDATDLSGQTATNTYRYDDSTGQLDFLGISAGGGDGTNDVLGVSDDGSTVYFNAPGPDRMEVWRDGQLDTVYPLKNNEGTLSVSPNGRYMVFLAEAEVHLYDAYVGEETCISCPAGGSGMGGRLTDPERTLSNRHSQAVTDDGHAFFSTPQALLGSDLNTTSDVYEYHQGRLTLISPGNANFGATLADISPDGRDVYFATSQGLVGQDTDRAYDVYDARIGGGLAAQNPLPAAECGGDGCQGAAGAPRPPLTPGSARSGVDTGPKRSDQKRCPKGKRKVRRNGQTRCVKKQGQQKSKKRNAKHNRGANR